MLKLNKQGMTLVEIMVVLLISSIIMMICGTLIINSMGFFQKTNDANLDKFAVDKIVSNVKHTLSYASEVIITDTAPEGKGWREIAITKPDATHSLESERLLIDHEEQYTKDYYNQRNLTLAAALYEDDFRMDLEIAFVDEDRSPVYKSKITIEMINMKPLLENTNGTNDKKALTPISGDMKIYFKELSCPTCQNEEPDTPTPDDVTGTVADEAKCKDFIISEPGDASTNNKGVWKYFDKVGAVTYQEGDFVQYPDANGAWYRLTAGQISNGHTPDSTWEWKAISAEFDKTSYYAYGDIVLYNGKYYQVISKNGSAAAGNNPPDSPYVSSVWSAGMEKPQDLIDASKITPAYAKCSMSCSGTIVDKAFDAPESIPTWVNGNKADYVYYNGALWLSLSSNAYGHPPGEAISNKLRWQKIQSEWDQISAYISGDIIKYNGKYYKALKDHFDTNAKVPSANTTGWVEVPNPANSCK